MSWRRVAAMSVLVAGCGSTSESTPRETRTWVASLAPVALPPAPPPASAAPSPPAPAPKPELQPADVGWPADTRSLEVKATDHVLSSPNAAAPPVGKIVDGTRVAWRHLVRGGDGCPVWVALDPIGWMCSNNLLPHAEPPRAEAQPVVPRGDVVPFTYAVIRRGAKAYRSTSSVRAGTADVELSSKAMLLVKREVDIDGTTYAVTDRGLILSTELNHIGASRFAGVDLRNQPPPAGLAWVYPKGGASSVAVTDGPSATARVIRRAARRACVPVLEESGDWVRVAASEWLPRSQLRVAHLDAGPVAGDAPWIDVDLDQQTLVAYEGARPVFATLVSTGAAAHPTPAGIYHVRAKAATTRMAAPGTENEGYEVSAVPWAVRLKSGIFLHAAYWHDAFGGARSHGCVNLSPLDARFIYDWVAPPVPPGWSELEVAATDGPLVRIREAGATSPPVYDYSDEDSRAWRQ